MALRSCFLTLCFTVLLSSVAVSECAFRLEGEKCNPVATTVDCSLEYPSYDDECADENSLQAEFLDTFYHWPEILFGGEWGLTNLRHSPPGVVTVCSRIRECVFTAGMGSNLDTCSATGQPWETFDSANAYDWDGTCQAPNE